MYLVLNWLHLVHKPGLLNILSKNIKNSVYVFGKSSPAWFVLVCVPDEASCSTKYAQWEFKSLAIAQGRDYSLPTHWWMNISLLLLHWWMNTPSPLWQDFKVLHPYTVFYGLFLMCVYTLWHSTIPTCHIVTCRVCDITTQYVCHRQD